MNTKMADESERLRAEQQRKHKSAWLKLAKDFEVELRKKVINRNIDLSGLIRSGIPALLFEFRLSAPNVRQAKDRSDLIGKWDDQGHLHVEGPGIQKVVFGTQMKNGKLAFEQYSVSEVARKICDYFFS